MHYFGNSSVCSLRDDSTGLAALFLSGSYPALQQKTQSLQQPTHSSGTCACLVPNPPFFPDRIHCQSLNAKRLSLSLFLSSHFFLLFTGKSTECNLKFTTTTGWSL